MMISSGNDYAYTPDQVAPGPLGQIGGNVLPFLALCFVSREEKDKIKSAAGGGNIIWFSSLDEN